MTVTEKEEILQYALKRKEICLKLKEMVVEKLYLEMEPEFITDDQPLFGRGLELDSIDSLELAVGIYDTFQNKLPDGDSNVFSSINSMADYIINCLPEDEDMKRDITGFLDLDA